MTKKMRVLGKFDADPGAPELVLVGDGTDLFLRLDGKLIAKRGHPGTPDAKKWIPLEPEAEFFNFPDLDDFPDTSH